MFIKFWEILAQYLYHKKCRVLKNAGIIGEHVVIENMDCKIDNQSHIGDYSYVGGYTTITRSKIGRYCSIGANVTIGPGEHDMSRCSTCTRIYSQYQNTYNELTKGDVIIGNDVWIGCHAIIRRGVSIGNGAVIGANSFVNRDVPDFAIVAGSPARVVKYRFKEEICSKIRESKWWEMEIEEAIKMVIKMDCEITEGLGNKC